MERVRDHPQRSERVVAGVTVPAVPAVPTAVLPSHARVLAELAEAEQAEGWLARCEASGRHLVLNSAFVEELAGMFRNLGREPVLEVCAGDGSLATALRGCGVEVIATDARPPAAAEGRVERLTAEQALAKYRPRVVLGSFVPVDAGVDRRVLDSPDVWEYLVLNARLGGEFGARCLWTDAGWSRTPLGRVTSCMVSRHDAWLGPWMRTSRHGEAWLLSQAPNERG